MLVIWKYEYPQGTNVTEAARNTFGDFDENVVSLGDFSPVTRLNVVLKVDTSRSTHELAAKFHPLQL